jgi:hypothetical protein
MSAREHSLLTSGPARFALEATFIILAGAIAAVLSLGAVAIVIAMGLAWVLVAVVERVAKPGRLQRAPKRETAPSPERVETPVAEEPPPAARAQNPASRRRLFSEPRVAEQTDSGTSREWNLWELERRARAHAGSDAVPHEWAATFMSLREFAKSDGMLPSEFDALVRESFPELTRVAT